MTAEIVYLWTISRIAETFHCLPAVAEKLWQDDPNETALRIMELRAYANAKATYDAAGGKLDQLDKHPMLDRVIDNEFALQREAFDERKDSETD